jgi:hypothetical protein
LKNLFAYLILGLLLAIQVGCTRSRHLDTDSPESREAMAMITEYHLAKQPLSLAYQSAVIQQMLPEVNYFAERLKLPTHRPIAVADIMYPYISPPLFSLIMELLC